MTTVRIDSPQSPERAAAETAARPVMLAARDVRMAFGGVVALNDVSVEVHDDELLAVIGPNGAGKTSLMNCLSGFYRPQQRQHRLPWAQTSTGHAVHEIARSGCGAHVPGHAHLLRA